MPITNYLRSGTNIANVNWRFVCLFEALFRFAQDAWFVAAAAFAVCADPELGKTARKCANNAVDKIRDAVTAARNRSRI